MSWTTAFAPKVRTMAEAVALVRPQDRVMVGLPEPAAFLQALGARTDLQHVELFVSAPRVGGVAAAANPAITLYAPFLTEASRKAGANIEVLPVGFFGWTGFIRRWAPRVRAVLVAEPTLDGLVPAGASVAADDELVQGHRGRPDDAVVIGIVDPNQPRIPGYHFKVDDFDALVALPADTAPPIYDSRKVSPFLDRFVDALDELVPDEATLQAGVGGIPDLALRRLTHKRDLGIHTEVLGDGLTELWRQGTVTNRAKTLFPGESVFTVALPETWDEVTTNPAARLERSAIVLDPRQIAANHRLRCINATLQVDLFGQGNAEMIDGVQYSGVGGQIDFHRACNLADDGLSILTMESTAAGGTVSRIVTRIASNAVTSTRYDAHVVVTEHGVAWLRDATMRQKAQRLIAVAHPDFRAALTEEAQRAGLL